MCFQNSFHTVLKVDDIVIPIKTFQRHTKYPYLYFLRRIFLPSLADVGLLFIVSSMEIQQTK